MLLPLQRRDDPFGSAHQVASVERAVSEQSSATALEESNGMLNLHRWKKIAGLRASSVQCRTHADSVPIRRCVGRTDPMDVVEEAPPLLKKKNLSG